MFIIVIYFTLPENFIKNNLTIVITRMNFKNNFDFFIFPKTKIVFLLNILSTYFSNIMYFQLLKNVCFYILSRVLSILS